ARLMPFLVSKAIRAALNRSAQAAHCWLAKTRYWSAATRWARAWLLALPRQSAYWSRGAAIDACSNARPATAPIANGVMRHFPAMASTAENDSFWAGCEG